MQPVLSALKEAAYFFLLLLVLPFAIFIAAVVWLDQYVILLLSERLLAHVDDDHRFRHYQR